MNEVQFQYKMGKAIILSNIIIFVLVGIGYGLGTPFLDEVEPFGLLKILGPVATIYMTVVIKFLVSTKNIDLSESTTTVNPFYTKVTTLVVYGHFILLIGLILFKMLHGGIGMDTLTNSIMILEVFFGAYVGSIITDLFKSN